MALTSAPHDLQRLGSQSSAATQYLVAGASVGGALLLRYALRPWLGANVPYLPFFPAILLAAWYGGFGAGAMATALAALGAMYLFLPPAGFAVGNTSDVVSLGLFVATGLGIAWLNHQLRVAEAAWRHEAELATARAERLDAIINTTVDGIIVIGTKGTIEAFNRGAERMFGYPASEIVGQNVSALMPSPQHDEHDAHLERYLTTGVAKVIGLGREVVGRRRDGSTFPLHLSVGEMRIDGARKFTGMLHDLTQRAQLGDRLRASEARWRAVIDSAVDGIIVSDEHGRIESFNPAAERLFGHREAEVLGRDVAMLMPSPDQDEHDTFLTRYLATDPATMIGSGREVKGLRTDGTTFPMHLSVGQITVDGARKFTGILHDLTARVKMEEQLQEQTALARLGEMAAVMAHEVKNPLAGIRGAMQVFTTRMPSGSPEALIVKEIISRIDSLDQMMKDLLLFARMPQLRLAPTDIVPLIGSTAYLLMQDPAMKEITVDVAGVSPPVTADPEMLKIVFQNVLLNGAHAMKRQGRIRVTVETVDTSCQIAFIDGGPGIPTEVRDKIFTPFFTTKSRGSGLGLPTAKRLIEAHNGQIAIECPPTGGTTVLITLPLASRLQ